MENEIVASSKSGPITALAIREQVNLIQNVMKEVMQEGQHYGKIPGCGTKPTLLKPGAEKLSMTFRLRPIIDNDRDIAIQQFDNGHREIRVYCHVMNMDGVELATGVGSCSTLESKFRYRGGEKVGTGQPVPKEYWNLKKEGKIGEAMDTIGGCGFGVMKGDNGWEVCEMGEKMENPDIADTYNTVLKMAKKRAYVDGILSATGASDIFTQDIEDMAPGTVRPPVEEAQTTGQSWEEQEAQKESKPPVKKPTPKAPPSDTKSAAGPTISEAQGKRLYAIAMSTMGDGKVYKDWLESKGYHRSNDIAKSSYETLCKEAAEWEPAS